MAPIARRPWASFIVNLSLSMTLFISILTVNLYLLLSPNYVAWQYGRPPLAANVTAPDKAKALAIVDYLRNRTDRLPILTHKERSHLSDVRKVFNLAFNVFKLAVSALIIALVVLKQTETWSRLLRSLALSSAGGLAFLTVLLTAILLNFSWIFGRFHRLFFIGDSWLFAGDSLLIRLFPFEFWVRAGLHWALLAMVELTALAVGAIFAGRLKLFRQLNP